MKSDSFLFAERIALTHQEPQELNQYQLMCLFHGFILVRGIPENLDRKTIHASSSFQSGSNAVSFTLCLDSLYQSDELNRIRFVERSIETPDYSLLPLYSLHNIVKPYQIRNSLKNLNHVYSGIKIPGITDGDSRDSTFETFLFEHLIIFGGQSLKHVPHDDVEKYIDIPFEKVIHMGSNAVKYLKTFHDCTKYILVPWERYPHSGRLSRVLRRLK